MPPDLPVLVRWYRGDGERVRVGERLCELEMAHATVDLEAWTSGVLRCHAREGDRVSPTTPLAEIISP